jgi:hypothetical protein
MRATNGLVGLAVLLVAIEAWQQPLGAQTMAAPPTGGGINAPNNSGIITQGQTGNNTIINQRPKLTFTDALGQELLVKIPKDKPVEVLGVGSQSDINVALQIGAFLSRNGYVVTINGAGVLSPPPERAITWNPIASRLIVAPSAH